MRNLKIGTKIFVILLVVALLPLFMIAYASVRNMQDLSRYALDASTRLGTRATGDSSDALRGQAEEYIVKIAALQAVELDGRLATVETELVAMTAYLEGLYEAEAGFEGFLPPAPDETAMGEASAKYQLAPGVEAGQAVTDEVLLLSAAEYMLGPLYAAGESTDNIYLGTQSGISYRYSQSNLFNPEYDPRERAWYGEAKQASGRPVWIETYLDAYGQLCVTNAVAFYNGGDFAGVLATDITLQQMQREIAETRVGETGYAFLMDETGTLLAHPLYAEQGFDPDMLRDAGLAGLAGHGEQTGLATAELDGEEYYVAYSRLATTGWVLGIAVETGEIVAPALATSRQMKLYLEESQAYISDTLLDVLVQFVVLLAASAMVVLVAAMLLARTITTPIRQLCESVASIGRGDLAQRVAVKGRDEIAELGGTFNTMAKDLQQHIREVERVTAEKERIGAELSVATRIQANMLPSIFPAFPARREFDIYATMQPAREVGGDFYDFYFVDENRLVFLIADVSGKGVPAALFMVVAKTLLKNQAMLGAPPDEVLAAVNSQLCENNDESMFVTAFLCQYDLASGRLCYANAGHNPPCLLREDGTVEMLKTGRSLVLGGLPGAAYEQGTLQLAANERLLLYTDGVTEAMAPDGALYGEERLRKTLRAQKPQGLAQTLEVLGRDIEAFAQGEDQADDITMLLFRRLE